MKGELYLTGWRSSSTVFVVVYKFGNVKTQTLVEIEISDSEDRQIVADHLRRTPAYSIIRVDTRGSWVTFWVDGQCCEPLKDFLNEAEL